MIEIMDQKKALEFALKEERANSSSPGSALIAAITMFRKLIIG